MLEFAQALKVILCIRDAQCSEFKLNSSPSDDLNISALISQHFFGIYLPFWGVPLVGGLK